ncbi:hypothetical protein CUZ56_01189 [Saezia sanguinis]|uniref:Phage integrase central domain-containing protein n=1 Tax=Saezia sanguinis TaxID=1965230 RepID=A0A433SEX4_9BURK|nr:integrase family protein [Saezia sanguinis]RUS67246.1 hypothetical protein CUZ56_01189 [Saezia sanguinis]
MSLLTDKKIKNLQPGQWATESNTRGAGQLQARGLQNKRIAYYFRYTDSRHQQIRIPLGSGLSLLEARRQASILSRQLQENFKTHPLPGSRTRTSRPSTQQHTTFGVLLLTYVSDLQRRKCSSSREVKNTLERHIHQAYPQYWNLPAIDITTDHILEIIRAVSDQGKPRAADKLRCHIRAAYAAAIQARQHIDGMPAFIELSISTNPARDIPPIRNSSQTKDRVLSITELQAYWQHIKNLNTTAGALLRFHLLTGGQRIQQLARATYHDYDADSQTLTLKDPKGRRHQPRLHTIPILPQAHEAMQEMLLPNNPTTNSPHHPIHVWTITQGQHGACYSTASKALKQVIAQMKRRGGMNNKHNHSGGDPYLTDFTLGDIRRTIETRLAAAGVSRETRAQLQSHGLSGVQVRHYDRHDYLNEKRQALETLYRLLTEPHKTSESSTNPIPVEVETQTATAVSTPGQAKQPATRKSNYRFKPTVLAASPRLTLPSQHYSLPHRAGP